MRRSIRRATLDLIPAFCEWDDQIGSHLSSARHLHWCVRPQDDINLVLLCTDQIPTPRIYRRASPSGGLADPNSFTPPE